MSQYAHLRRLINPSLSLGYFIFDLDFKQSSEFKYGLIAALLVTHWILGVYSDIGACSCLLGWTSIGVEVFDVTLVNSCELPNWIQALRQVNACTSRSSALPLFFPSGMQSAAATNQPPLAPGRRGMFR